MSQLIILSGPKHDKLENLGLILDFFSIFFLRSSYFGPNYVMFSKGVLEDIKFQEYCRFDMISPKVNICQDGR